MCLRSSNQFSRIRSERAEGGRCSDARRLQRPRCGSADPSREVMTMADRRAGKRQGPYVASPGGGTEPRSRNKDGEWRKKRSDAKPPPAPKKK
jgi:hypothetical protein